MFLRSRYLFIQVFLPSCHIPAPCVGQAACKQIRSVLPSLHVLLSVYSGFPPQLLYPSSLCGSGRTSTNMICFTFISCPFICLFRFSSPAAISQLPVWVRPHVNKYDLFYLHNDIRCPFICLFRFSSPAAISQLPVWVRPHVNKYDLFYLH